MLIRLTCALFLLSVSAFAADPFAFGKKEALDNRELLAAVRNRKPDDKITDKPVKQQPGMSALCRAAPTQKQMDQDASDPHKESFIQVFASGVKPAAFKDQAQKLPVNTIVIKEKIPVAKTGAAAIAQAPDEGKTELFTVMIKREAGYNPEAGDWEFAVVNGEANRVLARGKIESCMECHRIRKDSDFLYRSYLLKRIGE